MNIIEVRSQKDWDTLLKTVPGYTEIRILEGEVTIREIPGSATVQATGSATVHATGSTTVHAYESATVHATGSTTVHAYESATVHATGSTTVHATSSARVQATGSATVHATGSATVQATGSACVTNESPGTTIELMGYAVAILVSKARRLTKRSKTCTVVKPKAETGVAGWLARHAITPAKTITLYKRVSKEWKTQEGTPNETLWDVGATLVHQNWHPTTEECGAGKYHACPEPFFCDLYRNTAGDRYVAIKVAVADLHAWDGGAHPHKIAFRRGTVLHECDVNGKEIK